jgi:hypothetical protein
LAILENIGRLSAAFAHLDERTPVLRGGSGLGAGTTFGFSLCDNEALGTSDKLGETATLDGRETMGAPAVCADSAAVAATTRTKLPIAAIVARSTAVSAALAWSLSSRLVIVGLSR